VTALLRALGRSAALRTLPRLVLAALVGAGAELAGIALAGTATWLIVRAAERPPIAALAVAIAATCSPCSSTPRTRTTARA